MKVLILTHTLNTGGAERVGANLANGLCELGWDVIVLANNRGTVVYELSSAIRLIWFTDKGGKVSRRYRVFSQLKNILKSEKPDIIIEILHVFPHELLLARKFSRWHCPIILTEHDSFERPTSAPMPKYLYYKKWYLDRIFDYVTVLTKADKIFIANRLKKVKVMYNPLFLNPVKEVPKKSNIILSIGRLDAWHYKGFDVLINSWLRLADKYPSWKLKIVGDGHSLSRQYLENLADGSPQIVFENFTTNIIEYYREAAIYCLASRYEGWGLVMVEAMSQGCATIACNYNGRQAECICDGQDGLLCIPENEDELFSKLELILSNASLRTKLQNNAIKSACRFKQNVIVKEWDKFLKSVIKEACIKQN